MTIRDPLSGGTGVDLSELEEGSLLGIDSNGQLMIARFPVSHYVIDPVTNSITLDMGSPPETTGWGIRVTGYNEVELKYIYGGYDGLNILIIADALDSDFWVRGWTIDPRDTANYVRDGIRIHTGPGEIHFYAYQGYNINQLVLNYNAYFGCWIEEYGFNWAKK